MSDKKRDFLPIDKDPIYMIFHSDKWEEIPDEDLWEDGEIREEHSLAIKIYEKVIISIFFLLILLHDTPHPLPSLHNLSFH